MDIKVLVQEGAEIAQPFLENALQKPAKTPGQKAMRKTFKGTAHLARLLPTGSVLAFQILSPVLTHEGQCRSITSQTMTLSLLAMCGLACFLLCFTDSFRDARGKVRYGMVTFKGLWIMDSAVELSPEEAAKYKLRFIDVLHAFMSILVFGAVSLFDKNVVKCFFPTPTDEAKDLLIGVPATIGVICSILFLAFPSKRHGIGCPLSRN
ncbi:PROTEIN DMP3 [Salix koriyanagi]|uniref:PROTEIN DMP3 n=1 Tax=Salix koriyanagi TaxID=2511006 RepID=A0A9Q0SVR0_9ROSI|nr:PROTEIN DMP3 [Salix koriyanagi]